MEGQTQEGTRSVECKEIAPSDLPRSSAPDLGQTLEPQSPKAGSPSLASQQHPGPLMGKYDDDMENLRVQISLKNKQLQDLKEAIAVQHLQPTIPQGPDDDAVTSKFSVLRYAITNLTLVELNGHPFHKPAKTDHKNCFARLTATEEDYKDYLANPDGLKAFFFEAVIWTKLIDRLLHSPLSAFIEVNEAAIRDQVYMHSGANPQKFHAWRAYTADFLEGAIGPRGPWRPSGPSRLRLIQDLAELLSRYSTSGAGNVASLTQQLDDVVDKAVNLAWAMAKSRAYWVCGMPTCPKTGRPHSFSRPKDFMKVEVHLQGGCRDIVDLVGRPSMLKFGDSSGEQYVTCFVAYKAVALVFGGKKPKNTDATYTED